MSNMLITEDDDHCNDSLTVIGDNETFKKPQVGMYFPSLDEAYNFYQSYARVLGFDIRKSSQKLYVNKMGGNREVAVKLYVCNKEGSWNEDVALSPIGKRKSGSFRCGCKASMTVRIQFSSRIWTVVNFKEQHNHCLTSPTKQHYMKMNREVSVSMSTYIDVMESVGFTNSQISRLITSQSGGYNKTDATMTDIKNFRRDKRQEIKEYDAEILLEHFKSVHCREPGFFYSYKVDESNRLTHIFWSDATCRQDYGFFGEAVTFDTTFKTNQYHMIFAAFCGVNHHRMTVFFGSAFILNETKESFLWLFEQFKTCMADRSPNVIITDQDRGMKAAVAIAFPQTVHRLCCWHILSKLPVKLGNLINRKDIMKQFGDVVWSSNSSENFEMGWKLWIDDDLQTNEWFASIYELQHAWVPIFLLDVFSTGMKTTQRSEGMNAFLRSRVTQYNTLFEFVTRYEEALRSQREKENYNDHVDRNCTPTFHTNLKIEKEAPGLYTTALFHIFQEHLKEFLLFGLKKQDDTTYIIFKFHEDTKEEVHTIRILNVDEEPICSCHSYQFIGIACPHLLAFLNNTRTQEIPHHLIKARWKKGIKDGIKIPIYEGHPKDSKQDEYTDLTRKANYLINLAIGDLKKCDILLHHLNQAKSDFENGTELDTTILSADIEQGKHAQLRSSKRSITMFKKADTVLELNILNPPMTKTKGSGHGGRPKLGQAKRYKSEFEMLSKKPRMCKKCGLTNVGHDSRNCPNEGKGKEPMEIETSIGEDIYDFSE